MTGLRFGRLIVIEQDGRSKNGAVKWKCKCDCGNTKTIDGCSLRRGLTKSCGCLLAEQGRKVAKLNKKYNIYDLSGDYGVGYTDKNEEFYFDLEDFDKIKDYTWRMQKGYPTSKTRDSEGKNIVTQMHRIIMDVSDKSIEVDHIYHKTNDNRKSQLRLVTHSENGMNKGLQSNNTSGVKGVSYRKASHKWRSEITCNGKYIYLGAYNDIKNAIEARKKAEELYFGKYNYIESEQEAVND